jgi:hypothetical protein
MITEVVVIGGAAAAAAVVIVMGAYLSLRSVRAGHGPSSGGIALQAGAAGLFLLLLAGVAFWVIVGSGLWLASVVLLPSAAFAVILLLAAVRRLRS